MTEPAKDTAIDIAPKTQPTQGRVPKIVAEINRVASRVRDRNKKEEDHDAEVLENDAPTPSPRPTEITRIVRENTHRCRGVDVQGFCLLIFISILLVMGCVVFAAVIFNIIKDAELSSSELMGIFIFVGALVFNVAFFGSIHIRHLFTRPVQTS